MESKELKSLIEKVVGTKSTLRTPAWWMKRVLDGIVEHAEKGDDATKEEIKNLADKLSGNGILLVDYLELLQYTGINTPISEQLYEDIRAAIKGKKHILMFLGDMGIFSVARAFIEEDGDGHEKIKLEFCSDTYCMVILIKYNPVEIKVNKFAKLESVLTKSNTEPYIPTSDYHPATKNYVDKHVPTVELATQEKDGLMSKEDKAKLDTLQGYTHPSGGAPNKSLGLYKISTDGTSHVGSVENVTKEDITALGIPAQDTTYEKATTEADGLMSKEDKAKLEGLTGALMQITTQQEYDSLAEKRDDTVYFLKG